MCVPTATSLSMNVNSLNTTADIHLVLSRSELEKIFFIDPPSSPDSYFLHHPNQTQAVSHVMVT